MASCCYSTLLPWLLLLWHPFAMASFFYMASCWGFEESAACGFSFAALVFLFYYLHTIMSFRYVLTLVLLFSVVGVIVFVLGVIVFRRWCYCFPSLVFWTHLAISTRYANGHMQFYAQDAKAVGDGRAATPAGRLGSCARTQSCPRSMGATRHATQ
jgi:polyferredoxin